MDPSDLHDHLTKLHEELRTAPRAEPRSSRLLGELMADVHHLLHHSPDTPAPGAAAATDSSLPGRLEELAVLFEVDHPTLAASSRRLIDLLGKAGV